MLDWLVELRGEKTQAALAKQIGIAQSTYAGIESGKRGVGVKTAKRIAAVLGFDWTRFIE